MKYEIKQEFLDLFNIETPDDIRRLRKDFSVIYDELSHWGKAGATNYESFLNTIELRYGSFIKLFMIYWDIQSNLYMEEGIYYFLYNGVMMTNQECQNTENYQIDLFKNNTNQLIEYFNYCGLPTRDLIKHFNKVNIKIDTRKTLCFSDHGWDEIIKKCDDNNIWFSKQMHRSSIIFDNPKLNEVTNTDELKIYSEELKSLILDLYTLQFEENLLTLGEKTLKESNKVRIILHVGSEPDIDDDYSLNVSALKVKNNILFIRDFIDHPEIVLNMYKMQIEQYINASATNRTVAIITHNPNVINYIRYLIYKGQVEIYDDQFCYVDAKREKHYIGVDKNGKFCGAFPSGFFDATLEMLLEIG